MAETTEPRTKEEWERFVDEAICDTSATWEETLREADRVMAADPLVELERVLKALGDFRPA